MSQFTSVRGVNPVNTESSVVLDTREAVRVDNRADGVVESHVVGDLVVAVTPTGNDGTASLFVNDEKVLAAYPFETEDEKAAFLTAVREVVAELVGNDAAVEEGESEATE